MLLRVQNIRVEAQHLRARCALAEAKASGDANLDVATKAARMIERERMPWALAIARLVDASVAAVRGDAGATAALVAAEQALTAADMHLYAAVTRYRRGQLIGGDRRHDARGPRARRARRAGCAQPRANRRHGDAGNLAADRGRILAAFADDDQLLAAGCESAVLPVAVAGDHHEPAGVEQGADMGVVAVAQRDPRYRSSPVATSRRCWTTCSIAVLAS